MRRVLGALLALALLPAHAAAPRLVARTITLQEGAPFVLRVIEGYRLEPVVQGLQRVRFFARDPRGRLLVTDMHDLTDNRQGRVLMLGVPDPATGQFPAPQPLLSGLRNPNSIAFHVDAAGHAWLYVALTQALLRYRYDVERGAVAGEPQTLARFPDYGLSYKYGGWHLTRTVLVEPDGTTLVSVGSSCNACIEKEAVRASIVAIAPDGTRRTVARGLRNAVGLVRDGDALVATNQGVDHLGHDRPDETMYRVVDGMDAGWPYCYSAAGHVHPDPKFPRPGGCRGVARPFAHFDAHASALGVVAMPGAARPDDALAGHYVVALHGSTNPRIGHGYALVRVDHAGRSVEPLVTGFLDGTRVLGRPAGVIDDGAGGVYFSDDRRGVVYHLWKSP
ncbi:PQQ-dependent sugar dehydrogenase [Cognatilysobacter lacus]|uniref:Glucose/sorbosone dehydrogenase n=1 Tax=Cognatilysobacter lacus TaxID=1643323 RepID=A0A5D8YWM6_9GAMM|nr:glucose/sorbosone dehydrogenase [Lysobacter lacus]TZF87108.1 glucose/sorbosone dehydrogenase [Lysobacter lacus]